MEIARHVLPLEGERTPDLRIPPVKYTAARQDAKHGVGRAIENDRAAYHARIGAELRLPECVAENRNMVLSRLVFAVHKSSTGCNVDMKDIEIVRRNPRAPQLQRLVEPSQRDGATCSGSHVFEYCIVFLPVEIVQCRNAVPASAWWLFQHLDNAVRVSVGEWLQQRTVNKTENCSVATDADRQRRYCDDREPGGFQERTKPVPDILR